MYKYLRITLIIFLILNLDGCSNPNEPGQPDYDYSLLFNLTVNQVNQKTYLLRTVSVNEDVDLFFDIKKSFLKNAKISLSNSIINYDNFIIDSSKSDYFNQKELFYQNNTPLILLTSTDYYLKIKINNKLITGRTQTPGNFRIIKPNNNVTINKNKITNITWTKSTNAKGYIIKLEQINSYTYNDTIHYYSDIHSFITKDTSFVFSDWNLFRKGKVLIKVQAYDKNYYNHIIRKVPQVGIEGAYGYFGSSVLKTVIINLVE